jgi:signal transduction histidine kinase
MLQECLTNIVRHARATSAAVYLSAQERGIEMVVTDNGCGFDAQARPKQGSFGLFGLSERAVRLGGTATVDSELGRGTRIAVRLPPHAILSATCDLSNPFSSTLPSQRL